MYISKSKYFKRGKTTHFMCQFDNRFSYSLYVPEQYDEDNNKSYNLAVIVHGSLRNAQEYRDEFIDFAERTNTVILSPLFPGGITNKWESDSYKFVRVDGEKFDIVLLEMIEEVGEEFKKVNIEKFLMHGYSGGGQFAHRFFYFHPERLAGVSIGAPGNVTLLDQGKFWYEGVKDVPINIKEMQKVNVFMIVGKKDNETWMIDDKEAPYWIKEFQRSGVNRRERLSSLCRTFRNKKINVEYYELEGVAHEGFKVTSNVKKFFESVLFSR